MVPKECPADPKGSTTSSQRIHGYISVTDTLKFTYFFKLKKNVFKKIQSRNFINWRIVYFARLLAYLITNTVPTKRATVSSINFESWSALLPMLLVCIDIYLKSVLRYKHLILDNYYSDILYVRERGCEDMCFFFSKPKSVRQKKLEKHCAREMIPFRNHCSQM